MNVRRMWKGGCGRGEVEVGLGGLKRDDYSTRDDYSIQRYLRDRPKKVTHCTKLKVAKSVTTGLIYF